MEDIGAGCLSVPSVQRTRELCNSPEWTDWRFRITPTGGPGSDQRAGVLQVAIHDRVARAHGEGQNGQRGVTGRILRK